MNTRALFRWPIAAVTFVLVAYALSSCTRQKRVDYDEEAGSAHVSILAVTDWDSFRVNYLQSAFALSEADALKAVVPNSILIQRQISNSTQISGGLGSPAPGGGTPASAT